MLDYCLFVLTFLFLLKVRADTANEAYQMLVRVRKSEIVFNRLIIYCTFSASCWSYRTLKVLAVLPALLTPLHHAILFWVLGTLMVVLNYSWFILWEAPVASVWGTEFPVLIIFKYLKETRVLPESLSDFFRHALIDANLSTVGRGCEGKHLSEGVLIRFTVKHKLANKPPWELSNS